MKTKYFNIDSDFVSIQKNLQVIKDMVRNVPSRVEILVILTCMLFAFLLFAFFMNKYFVHNTRTIDLNTVKILEKSDIENTRLDAKFSKLSKLMETNFNALKIENKKFLKDLKSMNIDN